MTTLPALLRPASYVYGTWHTAPDGPTVLDAVYGRPLAVISSEGVDFAATLRPTPWRGLLLPGATDPAPATALGLITDPADPRLRIRACTGAPRCASGLIDTRAAATAAAARGIPGLLHVSGCGKGCAHPGPAPRLLLGTARGHAVARGARAGDPPALDGLTLDAALEALA